MVEITQEKTTYTTVRLSPEEAKHVTIDFIRKEILGDGCYINSKGNLEHWTSYPHGSGTTTDHGEPSLLQKVASDFLELLEKQKSK